MDPRPDMDLPRLSVVLPNYNHARFLPVCFKALVAQSVPPFEIIVIDDASTDNSMEVITSFARQHPAIRVFQNERNQGVVFGMNRGVELAQGEYLHFASADDQVKPGLFEKSLRLLAAHPQAALCCTVSEWSYASSGLTWHMAAGMADQPSYFSPADMVRVGHKGKLAIVSHSAVMRKQAVCEVGGFLPELRWHCDWFATYTSAFRHGMCYVPEPLSSVTLHERSFYGSGRQSGEHQRVLARLLELLSSKEFADVAPLIRDSGALSLFAMPMLRMLLRRSEYRWFITPLLVARTLRRSSELLGKRILPEPLARVCLRLFYRHR